MGKAHASSAGRLSASSLLETVLAMALVGSALSFALWMHMRVLATDRAMLRLRAWSITEEWLTGRGEHPLADLPSSISLHVDRSPLDARMERVIFTLTHGGRELLVREVIQPQP